MRLRSSATCSSVGAGVVGTLSGTIGWKPVLASTCSTVTPGCTDFSRIRLLSSSKSKMQSGVMQ